MNSDQMLNKAVRALQVASGCSADKATAVVLAISAYTARLNEEIISQHGPAWDRWKALENDAQPG